jgi:hypothetical protein
VGDVICLRVGVEEIRMATVAEIEKRLRQLPPDKLVVVLDFVSYLAERQFASEAFQTMLASEAVLRRDWDRPEEDEAWQDL